MNNLKLFLLITLMLPINTLIAYPSANEIKQALAAIYEHNPLIAAIYIEDLKQVEALLLEGVDINAPESDGRTPLRTAIFCENAVEIVKLLLANGADTSIIDWDIIRTLYHIGYDYHRSKPHVGYEALVALLMPFARSNHINRFKQIILENPHNELIEAIVHEDLQRVEALLAAGAEINAGALTTALGCLNGEIVALLVRHRIDVHTNLALSFAVQDGILHNIVTFLFEFGTNISKTGKYDITPLMHGIVPSFGNADMIELIELLLEHAAIINARCDLHVMDLGYHRKFMCHMANFTVEEARAEKSYDDNYRIIKAFCAC